MSLEKTKELISEYCKEEFHEIADFTDLRHVDIAYATTEDDELPIEVYVDISEMEIIYKVKNKTVIIDTFSNLTHLNMFLEDMRFDELVADAEEAYMKGKEKNK